MWGGLAVNIPTGWHLCDGTSGTPDLRGLFIKGATDGGATGGAATHGHTVTQPGDHAALAHSGATVGTSGAGSAHTHTQGAVTQPTIAWPAGVPTAANESSHTHTGASAGTTPKLFTSNTSSGVPGVTGGGTAHGHTLSWPAGVPTATLSAVANPANESAHTHAAGTVGQASNHAALSHTGAGVNTVSNDPAFYSLAYIQKV